MGRLPKITHLEVTKNEFELRSCLLNHSAIVPPFSGEWFLHFCPLLDILPAKPALPNPVNLTAHVLGIVFTGNKTGKSRSLPQGSHYALEEDRGISLKCKGKITSNVKVVL